MKKISSPIKVLWCKGSKGFVGIMLQKFLHLACAVWPVVLGCMYFLDGTYVYSDYRYTTILFIVFVVIFICAKFIYGMTREGVDDEC